MLTINWSYWESGMPANALLRNLSFKATKKGEGQLLAALWAALKFGGSITITTLGQPKGYVWHAPPNLFSPTYIDTVVKGPEKCSTESQSVNRVDQPNTNCADAKQQRELPPS